MNVFKEALQGHILTAVEKIWDTLWNNMPTELKNLVKSLTDDEGKIIYAAAVTAVEAGIAGKSLNEVADQVWDTLKDQVPSKAIDDLKNALGVLIHPVSVDTTQAQS